MYARDFSLDGWKVLAKKTFGLYCTVVVLFSTEIRHEGEGRSSQRSRGRELASDLDFTKVC